MGLNAGKKTLGGHLQAWRGLDAHLEIVDDLRRRAKEALCRHYCLVPGVTVLRSEGVTGVFQEVLNYFEGHMPWVSVRSDEPIPGSGHRKHFYHGWEIVADARPKGEKPPPT